MDSNTVVSEVLSSDNGDQGVCHLRFIEPIVVERMTKERIEWLWSKVRTQDYAFDDLSRDNGHRFAIGFFLPGTEHFFIGEKGYAVASGITPQTNCLLHISLWETLQPHELIATITELIDYIMERYKLNRVTAAIPAYNQKMRRLVILLGFRFEGELRQAILHKGEYHNVGLYGILRSEFYRREVAN